MPNERLPCRVCQAPNVPGAPHCWLCDAPDWDPAFGPLKPADRRARRRLTLPLTVAVAVAAAVLLFALQVRAVGLATVAGGVGGLCLGVLLIGEGSRPQGGLSCLGLLAMLVGVVVLLLVALVVAFMVVCAGAFR